MAIKKIDITTQLVRATLSETSNNVGKLCSSSKINKWSKYKPVIYPVHNTDSIPYWWRANDGFCGFKVPILTHPIYSDDYKWEYVPPTGGQNAPYRLGDFRGYEHNALPIMGHNYSNGLTINKYDHPKTFTFTFNVYQGVTNEVNLTIDDFDIVNIKNSYISIYVVNNATGNYISALSAQYPITYKEGVGAGIITLDTTNMSTGYYTVYVFLSTHRYTGIFDVTGLLYPIPAADSVKGKFNLKVEETPGLAFTVKEVSWNQLGTFATPQELSNGKRLRTTGSVCLKCTVISTNGSEHVLNKSSLRWRSPSFFGTTETVTPTLYDENKNSIDILRIPPSGNVTVYLYSTMLLSMYNGQSLVVDSNVPIIATMSIGISQVSSSNFLLVGSTIFLAVSGSYGIVNDIWM